MPFADADRFRLTSAVLLLLTLAVASLFIGVADVSWRTLLSDDTQAQATQFLVLSRIPRTLALMLAGMAMSVAGLIMQLVARNRFVEPSTAGTVESAALGFLLASLLVPEWPVFGKMLAAASCALLGTVVFLMILRRIPLRSVLIVPLIGLMLGGVVESITTFIAYRFDLLQSLSNWTSGDFSGVLQGRYELLWLGFGLTLLAYAAADRLTLAGLGEAFATNLGLHYQRIVMLALLIVAMVTAVVVTTVGMIPFIGLIIPNLVSLFMGDNARRAIPWVAVCGAGFVVLCDILGRLIRHPYEMPAGTIAGVLGAALFLYLLLRRNARHG